MKTAEHKNVPFADEQIAMLEAELEKARATCAVLVSQAHVAFGSCRISDDYFWPTEYLVDRKLMLDLEQSALSTDCGHGWLSPEQARELEANNALLVAALEKVRGYGKSDMGHQQLCDYVSEVVEEALAQVKGQTK
jgi:hypothetical protein